MTSHLSVKSLRWADISEISKSNEKLRIRDAISKIMFAADREPESQKRRFTREASSLAGLTRHYKEAQDEAFWAALVVPDLPDFFSSSLICATSSFSFLASSSCVA